MTSIVYYQGRFDKPGIVQGSVCRWGQRVGRVAQRSWVQANAKRLRAVKTAGWVFCLNSQTHPRQAQLRTNESLGAIAAAPNLPYNGVSQTTNAPIVQPIADTGQLCWNE
jgi:hypothetical protein